MSKNILKSKNIQNLFRLLSSDCDNLRIIGGAVRDSILNKKVSDIDLCCKFSPKEISSILAKNNIKTVNTGIKYGTITAIFE